MCSYVSFWTISGSSSCLTSNLKKFKIFGVDASTGAHFHGGTAWWQVGHGQSGQLHRFNPSSFFGTFRIQACFTFWKSSLMHRGCVLQTTSRTSSSSQMRTCPSRTQSYSSLPLRATRRWPKVCQGEHPGCLRDMRLIYLQVRSVSCMQSP